jgi:transcriptional regulator with XRE-family HTH domain
MGSDDTYKTISDHIRKLLKQKGVSPSAFGPTVGIDKSYFSRLMRGERPWSLEHLEKISQALGVGISDLIDQFVEVPIVREISATERFNSCRHPRNESALDTVPAPRLHGVTPGDMAGLYGIRIKNGSYAPYFSQGTVLIAQKNTSEQIRSEDTVIYCDPQGQSHIGRVTLYNDHLLLESLNPADPEKLLLDRRQLRMMDRIIFIKL